MIKAKVQRAFDNLKPGFIMVVEWKQEGMARIKPSGIPSLDQIKRVIFTTGSPTKAMYLDGAESWKYGKIGNFGWVAKGTDQKKPPTVLSVDDIQALVHIEMRVKLGTTQAPGEEEDPDEDPFFQETHLLEDS